MTKVSATQITGEDKQAWRKKPRKFAPKSRLGCKTCKIRRIKCDLARPSCQKCQSTGRTCDGYPQDAASPGSQVTVNSSNSSITASSVSNRDSPIASPRRLGTLMALPVADPCHADVLSFFTDVAIHKLTEYRPCESWRQTLLFFAHTVPSVRHAALALASIQRHCIEQDSGIFSLQQADSQLWSANTSPLFHYNRAIQLLLLDQQNGGDTIQTRAITLLVCYLFTCFDQLAGNQQQAQKHLRGGLELSRGVDKTLLYDDMSDRNSTLPAASSLLEQVTRQIRRLDLQSTMVLVDWIPLDVEEADTPLLLPWSSTFQSLDHAADHLLILLSRVMRLRWAQLETPTSETSSATSPAGDAIREQLEMWSRLFETTLQVTRWPSFSPGTEQLEILLRLQYTMASLLLNTCGIGRELDYDDYFFDFQQCVAFASKLAMAHDQISGVASHTCTPEIGLIPALYIIGTKCRHPEIRREALTVLRRRPMKEAAWDSVTAARVVERVIEVEEKRCLERNRPPRMRDIAAWERVENLDFRYVDSQSSSALEINYNFCSREEWCSELLLM